MSIFLNEYFFIPRWQFYYGELFGNENLYAIGDFEKDSSMKLFNEKVNKINYCPKVQANFKEHCELALNLQKKLLGNYDVVIYAEADQFFVPDPEKYENLKDYLKKNIQDYIKVSGYNVIHLIDEEKTLNPNQSILGQRKYWCKDPGMEDKMTIVRKPVEWYSPGFHMSKPDVPRDPDLYNIHLHKCDFDQTNCRRNTKTNSVTWATGSGPTADGFHTWIQDNNLKNYWYQDAFKTGISLIPTKFHGII